MHVCAQSCLFVTPWIIAQQATLSMGFPKQEYWSGLPFLSPGDLPSQGPNPSLSPTLASLGKSLFSFSLIFFNDFFSSQCTHFLHPFFPKLLLKIPCFYAFAFFISIICSHIQKKKFYRDKIDFCIGHEYSNYAKLICYNSF